jgi:RNA polymerase sigma-70 factor (ECF subfamily)
VAQKRRIAAIRAGLIAQRWWYGYTPVRTAEDRGLELFQFDSEYVERLRAGDAATERHFVDYFGRLLRILLRARMLPPDRIEDVTQETFRRVLSAIRRDGAIRQPERFGSFVNSICKNTLYERERAGRRTEPLDEGHAEIADPVVDVHEALERQESRAEVRVVLKSMPSKDRELLRDIFFLEKDKDDICREKGVDREYLRVLLHRAKTRFRREFEAGRVPKREQSGSQGKA